MVWLSVHVGRSRKDDGVNIVAGQRFGRRWA